MATEPIWAVVVAAIGLLDMTRNYCDSGCLAPREVTPRVALSAGAEVFDYRAVGADLYLRRDTGRAFGPFRIGYGLSVTSNASVWAGAGIVHTVRLPGRGAYLESHFMPGVYLRGDDVDLGGPVNVRAGVELGWEWDTGARIGLSIDHRSNGGLFEFNPGVETVQLRVSFPTR
jgi:hypothetical protein